MEEVLLQTVIDKLGGLDKTVENLGKIVEAGKNYSSAFKEMNERVDMLQNEVRSIPGLISIPGHEILALRTAMISLTEQLKKPLQQRVKNIISLNLPFQFCLVLFGVIVWLSVWIFILYHNPQKSESPSQNSVITLPQTIYPNEIKARSRKMKQKIQSKKTNFLDSNTFVKKIRVDSLTMSGGSKKTMP